MVTSHILHITLWGGVEPVDGGRHHIMFKMTSISKNRDFLAEKRIICELNAPPAPLLRPSVGGGLGVFAFHDVPSRRFAPRFVYFWDSCKHSVELRSLFCLGRLCERRWLSSSPKLVTPLVICSQRKVVSTPEENASFATSPKRFFPKKFWIEPPN